MCSERGHIYGVALSSQIKHANQTVYTRNDNADLAPYNSFDIFSTVRDLEDVIHGTSVQWIGMINVLYTSDVKVLIVKV